MSKLNKEAEMSDQLKVVRHGEAMLVPVSKIPAGAKQYDAFVIAHSETGHHHVLESNTKFEVIDKDELFIRLFEPAKLVHKKTTDRHNTLIIQPGKYKVVYKNEYNPFLQEIQKVMD